MSLDRLEKLDAQIEGRCHGKPPYRVYHLLRFDDAHTKPCF
jgi:hypothetical protein